MARLPAGDDFDAWVHVLGVRSQRRRLAKLHLLHSGAPAVPALRRGLERHPDADVRRSCANILDNLLDDAAVPALVAALDDEDPSVQARALHALACDACKQNECRPADDLFVPKAFELLRDHPDPKVRASAIDALAKVAQRRPDLRDAVAAAIDHEPHPQLRNMGRRRVQRGSETTAATNAARSRSASPA